MSSTILNEISDVLNDIEKYWTNENLAKQLIIEDLRNNDTKLISKLLSSEIINEIYVQDIDGYKIFDKETFISMLRYKNYWEDSYTKYSNIIGLTAEGKYLNYNSDVVLDFPFKDCILEGGMVKEDSILKNEEKFYNQVIAKEEIDTLLSPKTFKNIKKVNIEGEHVISNINYKENLIIKGNNLLALYSLKEKFRGMIKLIYIDPPYNTGNDSFQYNDRFNHASWLTFMKNRLEVAKELLSDDGLIFIECDKNEDAYLKILMDEIFGVNNFVSTITVKSNSISGNKTQHRFKTILKNKDSILVYKMDKIEINPQYTIKKSWDTHYNSILQYKNGEYVSRNLKNVLIENNIINKNDVINAHSFQNKKFEKFVRANKDNIFRLVNSIPETLKKYSNENKDKVVFLLNDKNEKTFAYNGRRLSFLSKTFKFIDGREEPVQLLGDLWNDIDFQNTQNQGGVSFTNAKKPEYLLKRIIDMCTEKGDIVLDFFMGSGTTQAVAHKMNRQYIGIEQMDYINTVSVPRLQKVIEGEQGGVSKDVGWQGGGSFVYAELAKENQAIVESIINCDSKEELNHQINKLLNNGVLNYEVDFDMFTNTKKEFSALKLEDQKEVLIRILDSNQLYVNYTDMEDSAYNFTEDEIAFNHSFYGGE